jgi:hypothetical protein
MNEDQIYNINWGDYTIATTNPQGATTLSYYIPENFNVATVKYDGAISVRDEIGDDIKKMKRHISDMQTEINNLRAENQLLRNSLKDFVNEMKKIILKKEKNNE